MAAKKADFIYKHLYPWNNLQSFSQHILDSIIYNSNGLIAINKPYGVKIYQEQERETAGPITATLLTSSAYDTNYSISQAIPFLQRELNEHDLRVVKSAERFTSGITLLATNEKFQNKIRAAITTVKRSKTSPFKYLSVTVGRMHPPRLDERVGIMLKKSEKEGDHSKHSVILDQFSKRQVEKDVVKPADVKVETLATDHQTNMSLIRISSTQLKWYFVRVYCAHKGAPVFGDNVFGPRVRWMFGKPFLIGEHNQASYNPPTIPETIASKLSLAENNFAHVPLHLHLHELRFRLKGSDEVVIRAEPNDFFRWTCERLGLNEQHSNLQLENQFNAKI